MYYNSCTYIILLCTYKHIDTVHTYMYIHRIKIVNHIYIFKSQVTFDSPTLHDMSDEELGLGPVKPKVRTHSLKQTLFYVTDTHTDM